MIKRLRPGCFHGHVIKTLKVADFILTETTYCASLDLPRHAHENSYFCFALQGGFTERCGSREVDYRPSALTFRASNQTHEAVVHGEDTRVFALEISPQWIERLRADSLTLDNSPGFYGKTSTRLCARIYREFHKIDDASRLAIEGLSLELLAEASRQRSTQIRTVPRWLKHAREMIIERFPETLTLTKIASEVGVHPVYLSTSFRQKFGVTIGEFVRRLRIERACAELAKGDLSLASIAAEAGYVDQSHFSKDFKLYIGTTPNNYRRKNS